MQQELVDDLKAKAIVLIEIIKGRFKENVWNEWDSSHGITITLQPDNGIMFSNPLLGEGQTYYGILFKNVRPNDITKTTLDKAVLYNTKQVDVSSTIIDNTSSDIDLDRTYTYEITTGTTLDTSIGVDATTSIEQSISYGGAAVQGTTNIGLSITASYSRSSGESASTTRTITTEFTVPAGKKADINITQSVSDFTQDCHYVCALDYNLDFSITLQDSLQFDSVKQFTDTLKGKGDFTTNKYLLSFQQHPLEKLPVAAESAFGLGGIISGVNKIYDGIMKPVNLDLKETVKFHNASTGNVNIKETDT